MLRCSAAVISAKRLTAPLGARSTMDVPVLGSRRIVEIAYQHVAFGQATNRTGHSGDATRVYVAVTRNGRCDGGHIVQILSLSVAEAEELVTKIARTMRKNLCGVSEFLDIRISAVHLLRAAIVTVCGSERHATNVGRRNENQRSYWRHSMVAVFRMSPGGKVRK